MIMNILVALANLLEPGCFATELVDLYIGVTLNVLDEFEMRPYSLSIMYLFCRQGLNQSHARTHNFSFYIYIVYPRAVALFLKRQKTFDLWGSCVEWPCCIASVATRTAIPAQGTRLHPLFLKESQLYNVSFYNAIYHFTPLLLSTILL